jgi:hypothetical protein
VSKYKEVKTPRQDKQRREEEKEAQIGMGREIKENKRKGII